MSKPYRHPAPDHWAPFFDSNQKMIGCGDLRKHYVGSYLKGTGFGAMLSSMIGSALPVAKTLGAEIAAKTLSDALTEKPEDRHIKPKKTRKVIVKRPRNDIFKKNGSSKKKNGKKSEKSH